MSDSETLSPSELAYFETRGAGTPDAAPPKPPAEKPVIVDRAPNRERTERTPEVDVADAEPEADAEPAAETSDAPEAAEPAADDAKPARDEKGKFVPHAALHEERTKRQAAEAKARDLETKQAQLDGRIQALQSLMEAAAKPAPAAPQQAAMPDPATDPLGAIAALNEQIQRDRNERMQRDQQLQQQTAQQRAEADLVQWATNQQMEYTSRVPEFTDTGKALTAKMTEIRTALGMTPVQIQQSIDHDLKQIAADARKNGQSYPEKIEAIAKAFGIAPKPAPAAPAPAAPTPEAQDDGERLDTIARGQRQSATIGTAGKAPAPRLSTAKLADMSSSDFEAALESIKNDPREMRRLFGA